MNKISTYCWFCQELKVCRKILGAMYGKQTRHCNVQWSFRGKFLFLWQFKEYSLVFHCCRREQ